jgi:hypothetical protein
MTKKRRVGQQLTLEVLSPTSFCDRAAVRAFVSSPRFAALVDAVRATLNPDHKPRQDEQEAASNVLADILALAQVAASPEGTEIEVQDGMAHWLVERVRYLGAVRSHVQAWCNGPRGPEMLAVLDDALAAIAEEERVLRAKVETA